MSVRIDWKGRDVVDRIHAAAAAALETRTREAASSAREIHPEWRSHTGAAARSIEAVAVRRIRTGAAAAIGFAVRPIWFLDRGWIHHETGDLTIERAVNAKLRDLVYRVRDAIHAR